MFRLRELRKTAGDPGGLYRKSADRKSATKHERGIVTVRMLEFRLGQRQCLEISNPEPHGLCLRWRAEIGTPCVGNTFWFHWGQESGSLSAGEVALLQLFCSIASTDSMRG